MNTINKNSNVITNKIKTNIVEFSKAIAKECALISYLLKRQF